MDETIFVDVSGGHSSECQSTTLICSAMQVVVTDKMCFLYLDSVPTGGSLFEERSALNRNQSAQSNKIDKQTNQRLPSVNIDDFESN